MAEAVMEMPRSFLNTQENVQKRYSLKRPPKSEQPNSLAFYPQIVQCN